MLLFIGMLTLAFNIQSTRAEPTTIIVPDDYPTIQQAINAANPGDTIFVRAGTYYEHVVINKTVSLIGEDRNTTIIDGNMTGIVVSIMANDVSISGFWIRNGGHYFAETVFAGISLIDCFRANVTDNVITNNYVGISTAPKDMDYEHYSHSNMITRNLLENIQTNIRLWRTNNNLVEDNAIQNGIYGVTIHMSQNNTVMDNIFYSNGHALCLGDSYCNYIGTNNISSNSGGYI